MRTLAKKLGTGSSTLYWHVRDKDELLLLILDETLRAVTVPDPGEWDARLLEALVRSHESLLHRPAWAMRPSSLLIDPRAAIDVAPSRCKLAWLT